MSTQGENAATWTPNVAQQHLQNGCGADDLHAFRMLREAYGVTDRARLLGSRRIAECLRDFHELLARNAAMFFDELRRVACKVPLHHLVHAARVLKRVVGVVFRNYGGFTAAIFSVAATRIVVPRFRAATA